MMRKESRKTKSQSRQTEPLADLPLTAEQAEETRAGRPFPFEGFSDGIFVAS